MKYLVSCEIIEEMEIEAENEEEARNKMIEFIENNVDRAEIEIEKV